MVVHGKKEEGNPDEYTRWHERMTFYNKWIESAVLKIIKVGERVDSCDTENIWCTAMVEIVIKTTNRKDLLYIHYEGWNRKYDEYLYIDSHRLAPLGIYTGR